MAKENKKGFKEKVKTKFNKEKEKFNNYKSALGEVYRQAYNAGWKDCKENSPFGASIVGATGYKRGFKSKKRYLKSQKEYDKVSKKTQKNKSLPRA